MFTLQHTHTEKKQSKESWAVKTTRCQDMVAFKTTYFWSQIDFKKFKIIWSCYSDQLSIRNLFVSSDVALGAGT